MVLGTQVRVDAWPDVAALPLLESPSMLGTPAPRNESRPRD
jgi:hypothetical protein